MALKCLMIRRMTVTTLPLHPDLQWTERSSAIEALELARQQPFEAIMIAGEIDVLSPMDWFRLYRTTETAMVPPRCALLFWMATGPSLAGQEKPLQDLQVQSLVAPPSQDDALQAETIGQRLAQELLAREMARQPQEPTGAFVQGDLLLDHRTLHAEIGQARAKLTRVEFDLLLCLAQNAAQNVSREQIKKFVWRDLAEQTRDRTVDVHVRAIRKKLPEIADQIRSIYGAGYRFNAKN